MKRVLVVEDDRLVAELERDFLEAAGYGVEIACDGQQGLEAALAGGWDAIVLDVMLPGRSGFDVCREVRKASDAPIVMVTARDEDADAIRGLGLGADDYVRKPFSPAELVARVNAHVRARERSGGGRTASNAVIHAGDLEIDPDCRTVTVGGEPVQLANREFELLCFLAANPGVVFSRDALIERIWDMDALGDSATVAVHINRIRQKIEHDPAHPERIQTVRGAGYRFSPRS